MDKTTTQVIANLKRNLCLLEAINNGPSGKRRHDNDKVLEDVISSLKRRVVTLNKSNGQLRGITERKSKQVLRLQSENKDLLERLASLHKDLNQPIPLIEKTTKQIAIDSEIELVRFFNHFFKPGDLVYFRDVNDDKQLGLIESEAYLCGGLIALVKIKHFPEKISCINVSKI